ncbi:MAG: beta-propeller fold lactonase family protein [bacterium]|nr:beta-propeller fold lactonase family protein [bacterium]MDE0501943.1 beta-propeller fold lactonase family protein [bacterium]
MGYPGPDISADHDLAPSGTAVVLQVGPPNDELVLHPVARITGDFVPKSVVASGTGLYFAQNMMYRHTISVVDHHKSLVTTIDDSVDLRAFGYDVPGDVYRGAPVEAAFTSDGSFAFVSNYRMYGPGYDPHAGGDSCQKGQGQDSFVYRIDTTTLEIDRVYPVGPVPKHLAVTPDDRLLLVSNWCGFDTTVIDLATDERVASVDVGRYPRGIAVTSDNDTAYVAVMGSTDIAVINLSALVSIEDTPSALDTSVRTYIRDVGVSPRHLVLSPDDETLYATLSGEDAVVAVDLNSGEVTQRVQTGQAPRSMDISTDGTALYVVNYESHTMSKLRTRDLAILQELDTTPKPIGITYDPFNNEVWVSTYTGTIHVYAERQ